MTAALLYHPACQEHDTGSHPENGERIDAILGALEEASLLSRLDRPAAQLATTEQIAAIHEPNYVRTVERAARDGGGWLDWDTVISPGSYRAALAAAGCTISAVDAVLSGGAQAAFALVRPPGHHARPQRGMGFCLFNNIAVAARHALDTHGLERILIVDFDAHHGNGTQEAFYDSPEVLYFSVHLYPFYPGTGSLNETGAGPGAGYTVNVPLPAGAGDLAYATVCQEVLVPLAQRYQPQLVLVSAGYDAHWADPLTNLGLSIAGFAAIVGALKAIATDLCPGRLAFTLEGGYHLPVLGAGVAATLRVLLGETDIVDPLGPNRAPVPDVAAVVSHVRRIHRL